MRILSFKLDAAIPIVAYCSSSILMTLLNKAVMSSFKFHPAFLMLSVQSLTCTLLLTACSYGGFISHRPLNREDVRKWLPVSAFMAVMLYTSGKALQYLQVPLFTIFKNATIILTAYGERLWYNGRVTPLMLLSFILMVSSSIVGGWNDLSFSLVGYAWMAINCISSASFVLRMRGVMKSMGFKDFDTVYYNNILTTPVFLILSLVVEDWSSLISYYSLEENAEEYYSFVQALLLSGVASFAISYTSSWCLRVTNSTTYSMVGALNKLPVSIIAMVYFSDPVTLGGIIAISIGFSSGLVYTYAKTLQQREALTSSPLPLLSSSSWVQRPAAGR
ncbi:GDP-mannose transporter [Piptocephalis cylindrospora]|uniref:GDP-mannose transporter n=1 Tax=Piptocephalis cylindrospora TaxID=1907219 RepID=A0A4P9Y6X8_9FUNG|nr:GDP-mannose transporter [Piptocephalis cylindrospora]|eukprot:RKP14847.1 GDP-mannose transporter [Piptocephalis cylindrospora]